MTVDDLFAAFQRFTEKMETDVQAIGGVLQKLGVGYARIQALEREVATLKRALLERASDEFDAMHLDGARLRAVPRPSAPRPSAPRASETIVEAQVE